MPSIGLPASVAIKIVSDAMEQANKVKEKPLFQESIILEDQAFQRILEARSSLLSTPPHAQGIRQEQVAREFAKLLKSRDSEKNDNGSQSLVKAVLYLHPNHRAPHPAYLLPILFTSEDQDKGQTDLHVMWQAGLLLLWLLTGGEHRLDELYTIAPWHPPFSQRQQLRSEFLLPESVWKWLEFCLGSYVSLPDSEPLSAETSIQLLKAADKPSEDVHDEIRIKDIRFNVDGSWELGGSKPQEDMDYLHELKVRLVQLTETPDFKRLYQNGLTLIEDGPTFDKVSRELAERLREIRLAAQKGESNLSGGGADDIALFPEFTIPYWSKRGLQNFVRETGVAILAGLTPRELPRVVPAVRSIHRKGLRLLVNEATLILPDPRSPSKRPWPTTAFSFCIRKPYSSIIELGLAEELTRRMKRSGGVGEWRFLTSLSWYRFTYPSWGSFSVAICSDIVDTFIWDWLRGRIQHLFIVAFNRDIELFDQMTWTRAYELFANVAMVNHGTTGGTLAWTPKSEHSKELFRVHGSNKGISVTVALPISSLADQQKAGLKNSVANAQGEWQKVIDNVLQKPPEKFKTPPPGYERKG